MPRERSRYRDRRSASYSSESSYERKKSKSKHKRRSRSTDRSETSVRRKRSSSRTRHRKRSYSRSLSRDKYDSKSTKSSSRSRSKRSRRSTSRGRSRSQSTSSYKKKHKKSQKKSRRKSRSSSSRSSSFDIEPAQFRKVNLDDTESKIEKAIKAAEAAGLTMTKIPTYEYKEVEIKEDMPTIHDRNLLEELNSDSFVQKSFTSSKSKKQSQNIVIDLDSQTVKVPESDMKVPDADSIIDISQLPSDAELKEMWIKKLYQYRKKMLRGDI